MTEATDKALTPRALEAIEAIVVKGSISYRRSTFGSGWQHVSSMGGATRRLRSDLIERGYLTEGLYSVDRELARQFDEYEGKPTAKGLKALLDHLDKRGDAELTNVVAESLGARIAKEAAIAEAVDAKHRADREARRHRDEVNRARHLAVLRTVLEQNGLEAFVASKSDDELLAFARAVEGAEYSFPLSTID